MPTSRIVPCRNSAGASTATAPITAVRPTAPCRSRATCTTATNAAARPDQAEHHLDGVAPLARHERLDEHACDGGSEHDQHRRQQAVLDAGRWQVHRGRAFRQFGCGIGLVDRGQRVVDGRIDHVQSGFRIHAEHQQQRDQRRDDRQFAGDQVTQPVVALGRPDRPSSAGTSTGCRSRRARGRSTRPPRRPGSA